MVTPKLTRIPSMRERLEQNLSAHRNDIVSLLSRLFLSSFLFHFANLLFRFFIYIHRDKRSNTNTSILS
ncbi:putative sucrose synthase [Helianthus anomalus]